MDEPPITNHESLVPATSRQSPEDDEISLLDLAVVVAENLRLLVLGPLFIGLIALGYAFSIPPTFTARTSFLPPNQQQSAISAALSQLGALAGVAASAAGLKNPLDQYIAMLKSTTVADRLVDRFNLMGLSRTGIRQDARMILDSKTKITAGKDGLIVVEVSDASPQRAADIANAYVSEFEAFLGRLALTEAQRRRAFFEKQLEQTTVRLTAAELELSRIGVSATAIKANPPSIVETVARLQAQVTAQEVKLAGMRGYLSESAPEFRQAQTELAALRSQLRKGEASEPVASSVGGYLEKYRDFKYQESLFELYKRQFELAKLDEGREGAVIQVIDVALPPELKSAPRKALIATVTTLLSGVILLIWVFARRAFEYSATRPDEAVKLAAIRAALLRLIMWKREQRDRR